MAAHAAVRVLRQLTLIRDREIVQHTVISDAPRESLLHIHRQLLTHPRKLPDTPSIGEPFGGFSLLISHVAPGTIELHYGRVSAQQPWRSECLKNDIFSFLSRQHLPFEYGVTRATLIKGLRRLAVSHHR